MYMAPTEDMQFLIDDVLDVGGVLSCRDTQSWAWGLN